MAFNGAAPKRSHHKIVPVKDTRTSTIDSFFQKPPPPPQVGRPPVLPLKKRGRPAATAADLHHAASPATASCSVSEPQPSNKPMSKRGAAALIDAKPKRVNWGKGEHLNSREAVEDWDAKRGPHLEHNSSEDSSSENDSSKDDSSEDDSSEVGYNAECILAQRGAGKSLQFLVDWEGFGEADQKPTGPGSHWRTSRTVTPTRRGAASDGGGAHIGACAVLMAVLMAVLLLIPYTSIEESCWLSVFTLVIHRLLHSSTERPGARPRIS